MRKKLTVKEIAQIVIMVTALQFGFSAMYRYLWLMLGQGCPVWVHMICVLLGGATNYIFVRWCGGITMKKTMGNKEYAAEMRMEADKWLDLMPVTKELWLQIADRVEASPDPLQVQMEKRKGREVVITTAGSEESWFRRLFFRHAARQEEMKDLKPFEWGDLT